MKFKIQIDKERCKGCSLCIQACKHALLKLSGKINARGHQFTEVDGENKCTGCGQCAVVCPDAAIEIAREQDGIDTSGERRREPSDTDMKN